MANKENDTHFLDKKMLGAHKKTKSTEGGACLNRHICGVTQSSCSHRWQAHEQAKVNGKWYNWPAYREIEGKPPFNVIGARLKGLSLNDLWESMEDQIVYEGDWNLEEGSNFRVKCTHPYWHESHHIIPNGVLNGCIKCCSEATGEINVYILIRLGLLEGKYNLNHKVNMIILPMKKEVAKVLKLPRHRSINNRHKNYSNRIRERVQPVIDDIVSSIDKSKDYCNPPNVEIAKAMLEDISVDFRKLIREWGKISKGETITKMTKKFIKDFIKESSK